MSKQPNLLFILTDQQRFDTLQAYGATKLRMPNLNRLAEQSIVFRRAYVAQPVCTPSRGTLLTGLYPHNHGSVENNVPLKEEAWSLPELAKPAGHRSVYIGKWHLGSELHAKHGFDEWVSTEDNYKKHDTGADAEAEGSDYRRFLLDNGFEPDRLEEGRRYFSREFATRVPAEFSKPAFIAQETVRFIQRNRDRPFIAYASFLEPHPPYYSAYDGMYDTQGIELPPLFNEPLPDNVPEKYKANRLFHEQVGRHEPLCDERRWRELIARYWGACSLVDHYVGTILQSLTDYGLDDNTVIVFTSDHGDMLGDFRMLQKSVMYESAVRVPLLLKVPESRYGGWKVESPVSQVDLVPTLLELLGVRTDRTLDGRSLVGVLEGSEPVRDVFIQWSKLKRRPKLDELQEATPRKRLNALKGINVRTVVSADLWKLSVSEAGEHELYDLNVDPKELRNLAFEEDERFRAKREQLAGKIRAWQRDTGDSLELVL